VPGLAAGHEPHSLCWKEGTHTTHAVGAHEDIIMLESVKAFLPSTHNVPVYSVSALNIHGGQLLRCPGQVEGQKRG
jgi:hypothetical protein